MDLIGLVVVIIVLLVVYWAIHRLAQAFGAPPVVIAVVDVLLVLVFVLYLLRAFGLVPRL
jgi:hypothetical protein